MLELLTQKPIRIVRRVISSNYLYQLSAKLIQVSSVWLYLYRNRLLNESKIFTHLTQEEKIALNKLTKTLGSDATAVEIGSYLGASSCFIAHAVQMYMGRLFCIDTWENQTMPDGYKDTFAEFKANTQKYEETIIPLRGWSNKVVGVFLTKGNKINLLFIDGDHSYEACKLDWTLYSPLLDDGAIVVFHDTGWAKGVNKVIEESVVDKADKVLELPNMQAYRLKSKV